MAFLLRRPWGLYAAGAADRLPFDGSGPIEVAADAGLMLAAPDGAAVTMAGHRMAAQPEGQPFEWLGRGRWRLYSLPLPMDPGKPFSITVMAGSVSIERTVLATASLGRPASRSKDSRSEADTESIETAPADRLDRLVKEVLERLRGLADQPQAEPRGPRVPGKRLRWDDLAAWWLKDMDVFREPPMDVIVRHAADLARLVEDLAEHPRRSLVRTRERQAIGRIQEMDTACLAWYVRQPGRTAAEKGGGRQRLLAVVRREDYDTQENRVLKDYLLRADAAANSYVRLHKRYQGGTRIERVSRFGRVTRRLGRDLAAAGVGALTPPARPNYVLLHDSRYRKVWTAYLELLRRQDQEDEAWRWQARLWADFVRLCVQVGLEQLPGCKRVARAPLVVRAEQERGRWTDLPAQTGVYLLRVAGRALVGTLLDAQAVENHRHIGDRHGALGASAVLRVEDLADGRAAELVIWAVHGTGEHPLDMPALCTSAQAAMQAMNTVVHLRGDAGPTMRGLIVASRPEDGRPAGPPIDGTGDVLSLHLAASPSDLADAVRHCGDVVELALGDMFA